MKAWGGPGPEYEWPTTEHGITVNYRNNVWVAGNGKGDHVALKFSSAGKFLMQIGKKNQSQGSNDTANLNGPAGIFVYQKTNELFVADGYTNRRVIVFDADTGAYKRHWGAYETRPHDAYAFPPRAQMIQAPPARSFSTPVHSVVVSNDGIVYVADRSNNRLQAFGIDGRFVREVFVNRNTLQNEGTVHAFALSRDPAQRTSTWPTVRTKQFTFSIGERCRFSIPLAGMADTTRGNSSTCTASHRSPTRRGTCSSGKSTTDSATIGCAIPAWANRPIPVPAGHFTLGAR